MNQPDNKHLTPAPAEMKPAVTPEAPPPVATPPTFAIAQVPKDPMTAKEIIAEANMLAHEWNVLAKEQQEAEKRLWLVRQSYRRIHSDMRRLFATCKQNELPVSEEMRQLVEERLPDGTALPPKPASAENKGAQ